MTKQSLWFQFARSDVVALGTTLTTRNSLLGILSRRTNAFLLRSAPTLCLNRRFETIIVKEPQIDRHCRPDIGRFQRLEAAFRNDERDRIVVDEERGCADVAARNSLLFEKAARTLGSL